MKSAFILATLLASGMAAGLPILPVREEPKEPKDENKFNFTPEELEIYRSLDKRARKAFLKERKK